MQKSDTGREKIGGKAWKLAGKCLLLYVELTFFINRLYMKRPQIVERIREALAQVAPEAQAILYGSEARGDARRSLTRLPNDTRKRAACALHRRLFFGPEWRCQGKEKEKPKKGKITLDKCRRL